MLDKRERCVLLPSVVSSITTSPTVRRSIGVPALIAWILMIAGMAAGSQGLGEFVEHLTGDGIEDESGTRQSARGR